MGDKWYARSGLNGNLLHLQRRLGRKKQFYLMNTRKGKARYLCTECEEQLYTLTNFQRRKFVPKAIKYMRERLDAIKDLEVKTYVIFVMEYRKMRAPIICDDE